MNEADAVNTLVRYEKMLQKCAATFRYYAQLHRAKTPPDETKAKANEELAVECEDALTPRVRRGDLTACPECRRALRYYETLPGVMATGACSCEHAPLLAKKA